MYRMITAEEALQYSKDYANSRDIYLQTIGKSIQEKACMGGTDLFIDLSSNLWNDVREDVLKILKESGYTLKILDNDYLHISWREVLTKPLKPTGTIRAEGELTDARR